MTCQECGRTLTGRQQKFCGNRCSGRAVGRLPQAFGGRLQDAEWKQARSRKAGTAAGRAKQRRQAERVAGMTPQEAWVNGYQTAQQRLKRHYERWATAKAAAVLAELRRQAS
jgi:hypothetical protein